MVLQCATLFHCNIPINNEGADITVQEHRPVILVHAH